jgi:predicted ATPase/class 3 adenylate cyclase
MTCPGCGSDAAPDFAFCPRCGTRLAAAASPPPPPSPPAESDRRVVTVLFADLAGFTSLAERLDPEETRTLQGELFEELASAITQFDGFVEKYVGDAVMAVFGAPVAHEDDPERALRTALRMQERTAALSRRWEGRLGRTLALHIGVNTGPVVAGNLGSTPGAAYAVTGDTVNTAARLQHAAQPAQILVSRATYQLTQHAFAFEPLGDLALRGKAEPLPAYRLLGLRAVPRSARGLEGLGLASPLVGRDGELAALHAALDRMRGGRAQVVSLVGEAGAGKSRLLAELFARLDAEGHLRTMTVRRAACSSLGERTYGVLSAFLREGFALAPDDPPDTVQRKLVAGLQTLGASESETAAIVPLLGHVLGLESESRPTLHIEPEQLKRQIFLAGRMLFEWRLQFGPLMLVVEDLHWADAASVELLRALLGHLAGRPLLLLVTHRAALDPGVLDTGEATHTVIRLAPLSLDHSEALLLALFGSSASRLPARLRELVVTRAGGNPFYLEEVVRSLVESGVLVRDADGWRCPGDVTTVDVPLTLQGLLLSRLDRLPPDVRRVAQETAVLGVVFDERLLRMVTDQPESAEPALDRLCRAEILAEELPAAGAPSSGSRRFRFTHALVQEAVYQNVLVRRRTDLHGRAGQALETLCGGEPQRLEELEALGHHLSLSLEKARGARYLVAAGDRARAIYANDDALRHYRRALDTLEECATCPDLVLAVRERLGDLLGPMGQRDAARAHYETALAAHRTAGDRLGEARLLRKTGGLHWEAGDRERAVACHQASLALLDGQSDHIELAHLYQEMGRMAFRSGDSRGAIDWAQRALAHAEAVAAARGDGAPAEVRQEAVVAIAHAYNTLGIALARTGRPEEAVAHIERSVSVAEAEGLLQAACRGYTNLGVLYSTLDPGRAIETCAHGLEVAKKIGDLGVQSRLYANLAVAYCALTNRCEDEGIGAARAAIDLDRRLGQLDHLAIPLIVLGQIYQCHGGNPELALRCYREALELAEPTGEPQLLFPCYDGLATLSLELGDDARAEEYLVKAKEVCDQAGLEPDSLMVLPFLE